MIGILRRAFWPVVVSAVIIAVLAYFVFPTRTWLDQQAAASQNQERIGDLAAENAELEQRIALLRTDEEVERIARIDFNLVYPGEEAYALLPTPPRSVSVPNDWPFSVLRDSLVQ